VSKNYNCVYTEENLSNPAIGLTGFACRCVRDPRLYGARRRTGHIAREGCGCTDKRFQRGPAAQERGRLRPNWSAAERTIAALSLETVQILGLRPQRFDLFLFEGLALVPHQARYLTRIISISKLIFTCSLRYSISARDSR
jgi:hypothetical protein